MIPLFDYNRHNLIMESSFRFEGYDFLYFDEGIPYYTLFRPTRKLNSFWEVKYAAEMLHYLNRDISDSLFFELVLSLSDRANGHVIRTYSEGRVINMCEEVLQLNLPPYVRRYRRIVFNPGKVITTYEKMSIVGEMIGGKGNRSNKAIEESIYNAIETLMLTNYRITYESIGKELNCTRQTISKYITKDLKYIIKSHNHRSLTYP